MLDYYMVEKKSAAMAICLSNDEDYLDGFLGIDNAMAELVVSSNAFDTRSAKSLGYLLKNGNNHNLIDLTRYIVRKALNNDGVHYIQSKYKEILLIIVSLDTLSNNDFSSIVDVFYEELRSKYISVYEECPAPLELFKNSDKFLFECFDERYGEVFLNNPDYLEIALELRKDILVQVLKNNRAMLDYVSSVTPKYNYLFDDVPEKKLIEYLIFISKDASFKVFRNSENYEKMSSMALKLSPSAREFFIKNCSKSIDVLLEFSADSFSVEELLVYMNSDAFSFHVLNYAIINNTDNCVKRTELKEFIFTKIGAKILSSSVVKAFNAMKPCVKAYQLDIVAESMLSVVMLYRNGLLTQAEFIDFCNAACDLILSASEEYLADIIKSNLNSLQFAFTTDELEIVLAVFYKQMTPNALAIQSLKSHFTMKSKQRKIKNLSELI